MILSRSFVSRSLRGVNKGLPLPLSRQVLFSTSSSNPPAKEKFDEVLSFHDGIAAVRERNGGGAYHIDKSGTPVYRGIRYQRTFGFYAQRAAVLDFENNFFHIDLTGRPVYDDRYSWCGNFHGVPEEGVFRSPVRDSDNHYYYVDQHGEKTLGPFAYAGDPNSAGHSVVQDSRGNPTIIDIYGRDWCTGTSMKDQKLIEACVPHKGIAQVRDEGGWFYMNQAGQEVGSGERYLLTEPHYNGQARVRFKNGQWGVVDEGGNLLVGLGESMLSSSVELESISKSYWHSLALKHILENNVLQEVHHEILPSSASVFPEILKDCSIEMGLLPRERQNGAVSNPTAQLLNRGVLLTASSRSGATGDVSSLTEERCRYWLQDRYLKAWLDCPQETLNRDTFSELADDPVSVERSHRVLNSYADVDWKGAAAILSKLLHGQNKAPESLPHQTQDTIRAIVDMGGGYGSLLRELHNSELLSKTEEFTCIDRPEVVASALSSRGMDAKQNISHGNIIKHEVGDLFDGPLQSADLYLLSRVLHDWSDPKAAVILDRLNVMSPENARLCVIDRVASPEKLHALLSLHMYALNGSHERNYQQWQELFTSSGWQIDGSENLNGHKMFMLTKKSRAPIPAASTSEDFSSTSTESRVHNLKDKSSFEMVEVVAGMPTVRKAVITIGGLGTRMAPQSTVTPKALLPVVSREHQIDSIELQPERWEVRPVLSYILDQFHDTSHTVDQVYVVSAPQYVPLLKVFLKDFYQQQHTITGSKKLAVEIVTQHSARGFGDAVLAARQAIGDEPFMVALGDHIYSATCVKDMLAAYKDMSVCSGFRDWRSTALTGATLCNESEVQHTGLLSNQQSEYHPGTPWLVHQMVEKPKSNYGSFQLSGSGSAKYPSQLGIDVLPPSIFALLQAEKSQIAPQQEVDLRKVLRESLQANGCLFSCLTNGHRLDVGNPRAYLSTLQEIANTDGGVYQPRMRISVDTQTSQEQGKILRSIQAVQLEKSAHIPGTLRHALFGTNDSGCPSSGEIHISSSPGRMDLMCGFADYSGSQAIQYPTAERVVSLAAVNDNSNLQSGEGEQGMIRLACIEVADLSELSLAVRTENFRVRETEFPTAELFTSAGQLKCEAELRTTLSENKAPADATDLWELYLTGILHRIYQQSSKEVNFPIEKDVTIVSISDLPWNAGLASSAAVEVATAISLGKALQLPAAMLEPVALATMCKEVENRVLGAPCGILDQLAVTHPGFRTLENPLVGVRCRAPLVELPTFSLPLPEGLSLIALESGVKRSTASTAYETIRTSSMVGKAILEASRGKKLQHLCDMTPSQFAKYEDQLPENMTGRELHAQFSGMLSRDHSPAEDSGIIYPIRAATRFPIEENSRAQLFQNILQGLHNYAIPRESGLRSLGELMGQTHAGYSKCGLGTDATSFLVDEMLNSGAIGAKISGGGGGGAVVALVNDSFLAKSSEFEQLQKRYHASTGLTCTLRSGTSGRAEYHGTLRRHFSTDRSNDKQDHRLPRVLVANHGYPPEFNGGSEIYAQMVALQLKNSGQCESVHVFAREHDPYRPDFEIRRTSDELDNELPVLRVNYSREAPYFRFMTEEIDRAFHEVVEEVKPDIVHLHHMNHLSLNLPAIAKAAGAKVLYTLHDFWLMCPRGQFLQTGPSRNEPVWKLCDGQENRKCAEHCFANRYASGTYDTSTRQSGHDELQYWTSWIASRMKATRNACEQIDMFIAPSQYLGNKFINDFSLPANKVIVEPYGFFRDRLANRQHRREVSAIQNHGRPSTPTPLQNRDPYVFAYAGRHQPGKGINILVEAALKLLQDTNSDENCNSEDIPFRVKIFGRQDANSSRALQRMIEECPHPQAGDIFSFEAEYANKNIVDTVFNVADCLVVPSIWEENSPLVIHEAQQCGVPVITPSYGGMGELVKDAINGLNFQHRSADSLAETMQKAVEQPVGMRSLGKRGYLYSPDGQIPCIKQHTETLLQLFQTMRSDDSEHGLAKAASSSWYTIAHAKLHSDVADVAADAHHNTRESKEHAIERLPAPWRVTFDTNPHDCNFSCTMCEQHSEFSPHKKERKARKARKARMDFDIIRKTVADLAPRGLKEIIPSTMGEPLYYKHFLKILDLCQDHGVKLNLTTNGSFYGKGGVEYWAQKIIPVGSDVKISWNGTTQETQEKIMKGSNLDTQKDNLRKFIEIRNNMAQNGGNYCSVTLQLTFMEVNLQELPELVKFAIEEDCDRVKGHHLWAHFAEIKEEDLRRNKDSIGRWNAIASECREIASTHSRPSGRPFRLGHFFNLDDSQQESPQGGVCPFLGREAWVNHSGRFDPCCAPDEQRLSLGNFGNVTEQETSLLDIWNSDQYNGLVQNYTKRPLCKNCNMRRPLEKYRYDCGLP